MYKVEIEKNVESDISEEELKFSMDDLVNSIESYLPEASDIHRSDNIIEINTNLDESELKDIMKPAFSNHFYDIKFISVTKG